MLRRHGLRMLLGNPRCPSCQFYNSSSILSFPSSSYLTSSSLSSTYSNLTSLSSSSSVAFSTTTTSTETNQDLEQPTEPTEPLEPLEPLTDELLYCYDAPDGSFLESFKKSSGFYQEIFDWNHTRGLSSFLAYVCSC